MSVEFFDLAPCPLRGTPSCNRPMTYTVRADWVPLARLGICPCQPADWDPSMPDEHRWTPEAGEAEIAAWRDVLA